MAVDPGPSSFWWMCRLTPHRRLVMIGDMQTPIPFHEIEPYVRHRLGCGCPDQVFREIEDEQRLLAGVPCQRLAIGGRLLVYRVLEDQLPARPVALVEALLVDGRAERDRLGFNRLRVVLPHVWLESEPGLKTLADSLGEASRLHLHFEAEDE